MPWPGVNSGVSLGYIYRGAKESTPPHARAWENASYEILNRKQQRLLDIYRNNSCKPTDYLSIFTQEMES